MTQLHLRKQTDLIEQLRPEPSCLALQHFADIDQIEQWSELYALYRQLQQSHQPAQVLLILEDVAQCEYTSGHASQDERLYFDDELHFAHLDADAQAVAMQNYALYALKHVQQQLQDPVVNPLLAQSIQQIDWPLYYDLIDGQVLVEMNANPLAILDDSIQVKLVEATTPALSFAAMPNGYFSSDLDPWHNYYLIAHLEQQYGYQLMGMGASVLVFARAQVLSAPQCQALIEDLTRVYHLDNITQAALAQHVAEQDYLLLTYIESLYDLAACFDIEIPV